MTYQGKIINKIKENYTILSKEFYVKRIGIFGSVAKEEDDEDSDIDIIVEFKEPIGLKFVKFVEFMENLFGKKVDVLTKEGIKNIRVNRVASDIVKDIIYV